MSDRQNDEGNTLPAVAEKAAGRRRLLKLGAGMTPVLMAFASRSAFACHSAAPSAFGSVCNSRPELLQSSNGRSPGYWKNHTGPNYWPAPYYSDKITTKKGQSIPATTFKSVFCGSGASSPFSSNTTLLEVLESGGGGSKAVARACVAALLNAASGATPSGILSVDDVINRIWYEYASKGYYEPIAGIKWYSNTPSLPYIAGSDTGGSGGIIGYLNTTWT